jgi:hypothetical protein
MYEAPSEAEHNGPILKVNLSPCHICKLLIVREPHDRL